MINSNINRKDTPLMQIENEKHKNKITLYESKVVIERKKTLLWEGTCSEIQINKISNLKVTQGTFSYFGSNNGAFSVRGSGIDACFVFEWKKDYNDVMLLKQRIEKLITETNSTENETNVSGSVADEILKLKSLLDAGILTEEEFLQEKSRLLNR